MDRTTRSAWPWVLLPARLVLFASWQGLFALAYLAAGSADAWEASAAWWPFTVTLTNLVCAALLIRRYREEGGRFWSLFHPDRDHLKRDLLFLLGSFVVVGPVAFLPNVLIGTALFGEMQTALDLLIRPLPLWAAIAGGLLFGITQGLVELPTYFAYIMPRLEARTGRRWLGVGLPILFLAAQHIAVPLVFDFRFIAWRFLMFLPLSLVLGLILHWRPRLLPYLAVVHALMDLSLLPLLLLAVR
jgi:hypothetical protein